MIFPEKTLAAIELKKLSMPASKALLLISPVYAVKC